MRLYAPAEIVRDALEHKVEVLPIDVNYSLWDNRLERSATDTLAVRLGFRQIDGFREEWAMTMTDARGEGFETFESLTARSHLSKAALVILAEADCFRSLGMDRREGLWSVRRLPDDDGLPLFDASNAESLAKESNAPLPVMPRSEHVVADYEKLRFSLKGDPMEFLRDLFRGERILSCAELNATKHGRKVKCGGVIITRQMPGDAGVVFITLRDETGFCNALAWPSVFDRYRKEIMGSRIIVIEGEVQRSPEGVTHLISEKLYDRSHEIERLSEDRFRPQSHDDQIPPPADPRGMQRHPREVRVLPKSRDFH